MTPKGTPLGNPTNGKAPYIHIWSHVLSLCSEEAIEHMKIHIQIMRPWECFVPKHHVIFHPLQQTMEKGNPWFYSSWYDEGLNKNLKGTCRNASQLTFESTLLTKMKELLVGKCSRGVKRK